MENADAADGADLRGSESGFYPPHPLHPRSHPTRANVSSTLPAASDGGWWIKDGVLK